MGDGMTESKRITLIGRPLLPHLSSSLGTFWGLPDGTNPNGDSHFRWSMIARD